MSLTSRFRVRSWAWLAAPVAAAVLLSPMTALADAMPTIAPGQTVDVFSLPYYGDTGLAIELAPANGGPANSLLSVPLTYVGTIQGNYTPTQLLNEGNNWGTTWAEYAFTMPSGGIGGDTYDAIIQTSSGGDVFTRFVGFPDTDQNGYGTQFVYSAASVGQLPEFPYAALAPLLAAGAWVLMRRRTGTVR